VSSPGLVLQATNDKKLLDGLADAASQTIARGTGTPLDCLLSLRYPKRPMLYGGSSAAARTVGAVEQELRVGPSNDVFDEGTLFERNLCSSSRWPELHPVFRRVGYQSALCVPLFLEIDAEAVFAFFSPTPEQMTTARIAAIAEEMAGSPGCWK
jgi:hypothetical protein